MADVAPESAPPPPTFDVLPLSAEIRRALEDVGYTHPTPVQRAVFEPAVRGADLVVQARTGTGKTAAFGLPLLESLVRRNLAKVQALVLCPTRELAVQVTRELEGLAKYRGVKPVAIYGGAPMPRQVELIRGGAQLLVGTPGRVLDHLRRKTLDPESIRVLVLDESDEMLSMGFLPQISEILSYLPEARQTLLFSATLPNDIKRMAETRLRSPEFITLSGDQVGALEIAHFVYLTYRDKLANLEQILEIENPESAIIFCNTRDETKRVSNALAQQGHSADWLNADLAQNEREKVMAATRGGELRFLVATDVAARGIDISHLTHVINFDFPESTENYVHRTGRTGRAGRTGTAISLIEPSDIGNLYLLRLTYKIRPIERQLPSAREVKTRAETDLVKLFIEAFGARRTHPDDLALARRLLTHEQAESILAGLLRDHLGARPDALEEATAARRAGPTQSSSSRGRSNGLSVASVSEPRPAPSVEREPRPVPSAVREPRPEREPRAVREPRPVREPRAVASVERPATLSAARAEPATAEDASPTLEIALPPAPPRAEAESPLEAHLPTGERSIQPEFEESDFSEARRDVTEIFVNVGRRDGVTPRDFYTLLASKGLGDELTGHGYVKVKHRHSFVGVRRALLEQAISALNGATIAGKLALAEPSRGFAT